MRNRFGPEHERRRKETVDEFKRQAKHAGACAEYYTRLGMSETAENYTNAERNFLSIARHHRRPL